MMHGQRNVNLLIWSIRPIINTIYSVIQGGAEVSNLPGIYAVSIGKELSR
jgi:hypothetical protein